MQNALFQSQKLNKIRESICRFNESDGYSILLFILSSAIMIFHLEIPGTFILAGIGGFTMLLSGDLLPATETMMAICCFAIRNKHSAPGYFGMWYLAIPFAVFFILHFIFQRNKLSKPTILKGMFAVSIAILLGGIGEISPKEYFSGTSLFYIIALGIGMIPIISYVSSSYEKYYSENFEKRFSRIFINCILILTVAVVQEYISRWDEFTETMSVIPFQWRNNASTILMIAMPFAFWFAAKKYRYTFIALLDLAVIALSGSRGGLIFGSIEFGICFVVMTVIDKKHKKQNLITLCCFALILIISTPIIVKMLGYTLERFADPGQNEIRIGLIKAGINDFFSNPVFGRGLGYMGNNNIHHNAEHTLCWYHNSVIQVFGSFGILGVCAYCYMNYLRIKLFRKNKTFFSVILFLSFIGLEMMSLVNPGIFAPFPYYFIVSLFFAVIEKCNKKSELKEMIRGSDNESTVNR